MTVVLHIYYVLKRNSEKTWYYKCEIGRKKKFSYV